MAAGCRFSVLKQGQPVAVQVAQNVPTTLIFEYQKNFPNFFQYFFMIFAQLVFLATEILWGVWVGW